MSDRTHFVYEAYDGDGLLLYIGCTGKPRDRYRAHMAGGGDARGWFNPFVTHWRVSGPYPKAVALALEGQRISRYQPIWNGMSERNRYGDSALIKAYLAFHGVEFVRHSNRGRPDLRSVERPRRQRRLRSVPESVA